MFFRFTVAPTITAPDGSVMFPLIAPVTMLCAERRVGNKSSKAASKAASQECLFHCIFISRFPSICGCVNDKSNFRRVPVWHVRRHVLRTIKCFLTVSYVNSEGSNLSGGTDRA